MKRRIRFFAVLLLFILLFPFALQAARLTLGRVDREYRMLIRSRKRLYRDNWLRVASMYRSLLPVYPEKRAYIYRKLYMLYSGLYRYSGKVSDRRKAIYYRLLSRRRSRAPFFFSRKCIRIDGTSGCLVVSVPGWVKVKKFYLSKPLRLVIDVYPARFRGVVSGLSVGGWHIRYSQFKKNVVRLVFRVRGRVRVDRVAGNIVLFPRAPEARYVLSLSGIKRVVIDPGHGGRDPGAIGPTGLKEKDVVLDIALRLERMMKRNTDLKVFLTRRRDIYVPLDRRVLFARRVGADLFISIHVNASRNTRLSGLEVYYADPSRLCSRRGGATFVFASLPAFSRLRSSLGLSLEIRKCLLRYTGLRDNGIRRAPFFVLVNNYIPSVLVEAGYITNPWEERRMRTSRYRYLVARGIFEGLVKYLQRRKTVVEARL